MPLLKREPDCFPPDLFAIPPDGRPWWIAHVRSRQEKSLARHLGGSSVPFYLPQTEKLLDSGARRRRSHLPLFPGYVFFRGGRDDRARALTSGVVVSVLEVVDQDRLGAELAQIHDLQQRGARLVPHSAFSPGDPVDIREGAFRGYRGKVIREKDEVRLLISVSVLQRTVVVDLDREAVGPARHAS